MYLLLLKKKTKDTDPCPQEHDKTDILQDKTKQAKHVCVVKVTEGPISGQKESWDKSSLGDYK